MSEQDELIGSDAPLHAPQRATLAVLLDMIVPASADGRLPSAADVDVLGYLVRAAADLLPALREQLASLDERARAAAGTNFGALAPGDRQALIDSLRAADPHFLRRLALETVTCYYQDDRVLRAIGLEPRPPYPQGYSVPSGDLSLLEPVRQRGPIYREAT